MKTRKGRIGLIFPGHRRRWGDGTAELWGLYGTRLAEHAHGVLDFYHAAQNLWRGATAWLGGRSRLTHQWFQTMRHRLRHGQSNAVLDELQTVLALPDLPSATRKTLLRLYAFLDKHRDHMNYDQLKNMGLPIGSGLVKSAYKWLTQQRFNGVGMRWGEESSTHLLLIRLAWVNRRFDTCFPSSPNYECARSLIVKTTRPYCLIRFRNTGLTCGRDRPQLQHTGMAACCHVLRPLSGCDPKLRQHEC